MVQWHIAVGLEEIIVLPRTCVGPAHGVQVLRKFDCTNGRRRGTNHHRLIGYGVTWKPQKASSKPRALGVISLPPTIPHAASVTYMFKGFSVTALF